MGCGCNLLNIRVKRFVIIISIVILIAYMAISAIVLSRHGYLRGGSSLRAEQMAYADSVINQAIEEGEFPGAVLCVVRRALDGESMGRMLYLKAYGNRQVTSARTADGRWIADTLPMTTDARVAPPQWQDMLSTNRASSAPQALPTSHNVPKISEH